jgi:arginine decarboxylase
MKKPQQTPAQATTPYIDALLGYRTRAIVPFHTPGHKLGKGAPPIMREVFGAELLAVDVAMAGGVEDTRESTALVRAAEDLAAEAWGGERCFFLVNGSTSGIHALLLTLAGPGESVILPRNAHKSVQAALIFSGAVPHYVEPTIDPVWGIPLNVPVERVGAAIEAHPDAKAVFVVSPNSNGVCAALDAIAAVVHGAGLPLVVDQAWGPHLRFCSRLPLDAMSAGADAMVASTHKLISGITQSSVLVADGRRLPLQRLESIVKMTQSTSPQVLIYASIDAARAQMATRGEELWSRALDNADWIRARLAPVKGVRVLSDEVLAQAGVADLDRTRVTVSACDLGLTGYELETALRDDYGIAVEAADPLNVLLNVTYGDSRDDVARFAQAMTDLAARRRDAGGLACTTPLASWPRFTRQVMSPRDAFFARSEAIPVEHTAGRVSAEMVAPYPPGIPVVAPGEEVSDEIAAYLGEASARQMHVHGPEDLTLKTLRVVS